MIFGGADDLLGVLGLDDQGLMLGDQYCPSVVEHKIIKAAGSLLLVIFALKPAGVRLSGYSLSQAICDKYLDPFRYLFWLCHPLQQHLGRVSKGG